MTFWRTERGSAPLFTREAPRFTPARYNDLAALVIIAAAPGLLLLWLIPLPLVLPVLSIMSFMIAGIAALVARYCGIDRHAPGVSAWDVAGLYTLIWIIAGMMSGTRQFTELFDRLAAIP